MKKFLVLSLPILFIFLAEAKTTPVDAGNAPVLAFYYAWFDSNSWNPARMSELPAQQYVSSDSGVIGRHIQQAKAAGIDGFVQSWYGPGGGNQTETNFQTLLDLSLAAGFKAAVDFEAASPYFANSEDRVAALQYLLSTHANHPSYFRVDGKPVIFFWATWLLSVDDWSAIRARVDPDHSAIWLVEGASIDYLSVFDGLHLYNIAWSDNPVGTLSNWGGQVRARAELLGSYKYWAATVMPGWDDTRIPGRSGTFFRDRAGGQYYRQCWTGAAASGPDIVIITSFNEWPEGSQIEPGVNYGSYYLDLTAELAAAFRSGSVISAGPAIVTESTVETLPVSSPEGQMTAGPSMTPVFTPAITISPALKSTPTLKQKPTALADGSIIHLVEEGDTLLWITGQYSLTLETLIAMNDIDPGDLLWIGQPLVVGVSTPMKTCTSLPITTIPTAGSNPTDAITPSATVVQELDLKGGLKDNADDSSIQARQVTVISAPTRLPGLDIETRLPSSTTASQEGQDRSDSTYIIAALPALFIVIGFWIYLKKNVILH